MNEEKLLRMSCGIDSWKENFGNGMEYRGADNVSWYDLSINLNSVPYFCETAVIVTSWHGQLKWLSATLKPYRLFGMFVILAFDNPFYPWSDKNPNEVFRLMPNTNHYLLANTIVHKHITYDADKRNGWFWDVRYAQGIIKQFPNIKYVYVTNGDCICERPEGFKEVIELLGDADLMAGQSNENKVHTANMFFKVEAFHKVFDAYAEVMRVPIIGSRSPEGALMEMIQEHGIKVKHAPKQPADPIDGTVDFYTRRGQDSTWKEILGYRNLFAELEEAWNEGLEPLDKRYVDRFMDWLYFSGEERETICRYWDTGDRRYLMKWWDCGESSDYNRLYYPLEHYSKEPIYG